MRPAVCLFRAGRPAPLPSEAGERNIKATEPGFSESVAFMKCTECAASEFQPKLVAKESVRLQPKLIGQEPGAHVFQCAHHRCRQPRADAAGLR